MLMPTEPTIDQLVVKLRRDAKGMREILAGWPQNGIGNQNYQDFQYDAECWELAAQRLEQYEFMLTQDKGPR